MSDNIIPVPFSADSDTPQVKTTEIPESIKELLENPIKTLETLNKVEMQIDFKLKSLKPEIERLTSEIGQNCSEEVMSIVNRIVGAESLDTLDKIGLELDTMIEGHKKDALDILSANPDLIEYIEQFK